MNVYAELRSSFRRTDQAASTTPDIPMKPSGDLQLEQTPAVEADPRYTWVEWDESSPPKLAELVSKFKPLDKDAGHAAACWLKTEAQSDLFTVTHLLTSEARLEGFITCRVSEATLTWSGVESLGVSREESRKTVPAYLLCWCAKHRETSMDGEELILNAIRLGKEVRRYGCAVLALDPHDDVTAEKVWQRKYGFRLGAKPTDSDRHPRLWTPLSTD
ncbi:MAG TPA: hypothetical protein VHQ43_00485 [Solirubrobacterales bacterium]|jgi:hypothetical protein|nr:hypothetical protein [Solirubrobacterales bacterium]